MSKKYKKLENALTSTLNKLIKVDETAWQKLQKKLAKNQVDPNITPEKSIHPEVDYRDEEDFANAMHQKKADESKY